MNTDKKTDIERVVSFAVLPSALVGLFPYSAENGRYVPHKKRLFLSLGVCAAFTAMTGYFFWTKPVKHEKIYLTMEIEYIDMILMNAVCVVSVYELLRSLEALNNSLASLVEAEATLSEIGRKTVYPYSFRPLWLNVAFAGGAFTFRLYRNASTGVDYGRTLFELVYFVAMLAHMIAFVQRYSGLLGISERLFLSCNKEVLSSTRNPSYHRLSRLEAMICVHNKLCVSSAKLSDAQVYHVLLIILTSFVIFVSELYKAYIILRQSGPLSLALLMVKTSWIGACFHLSIQIVSACRRCESEAKEFNTLLYQLMIDDKTNDIANNKKLRLHIAMKREVVFTACGFFTLDYTLVHSMIAAATTYLVILIQFGQPTGTPAHHSNTTNATT